MKLLLATNNRHKIKELRVLLQDLDIQIDTLGELDHSLELIEDGWTFEENALKKARTAFAYSRIPTLADDSGLEVFYLNGRPGVFSARYAGSGATDERNNAKLLAEMRGVPPRRRRAQFVATIALVGEGYEELARGVCEGMLAEAPRGSNGFGYDPIFLPAGYRRTYAELLDEEKNEISHRSRALRLMKEILRSKIR
ncbi:MAG: RdgB/HAM1 family non-canonical purine NTP pyrophosphatase [Ignavibacteria bacterium]|nr:RdgB/HAM1 family non-canonical purine NTP pyrophosphatase [Ignavibacteria bacterium]